jgi:hypothetical protein
MQLDHPALDGVANMTHVFTIGFELKLACLGRPFINYKLGNAAASTCPPLERTRTRLMLSCGGQLALLAHNLTSWRSCPPHQLSTAGTRGDLVRRIPLVQILACVVTVLV